MDYVYLQGSETVTRAASSIRESAELIIAASSNIDQTLANFQRFLDECIGRLIQELQQTRSHQ